MSLYVAVLAWPFLTAFLIAASLLAYPLVPIAVALAKPEPGTVGLYRLPSWARWLETPDDTGGLVPGGLYEPMVRWVYDRFGWQFAAIYWLWRNKAGGLDAKFRINPSADDPMWHKGNRWVGDDVGQTGGWCLFRLGWAWEFYLVQRIVGAYGLRLRLGWRLQPYFTSKWPTGPTATGTPVPFHVSLRRLGWAAA